MRDEKSEKVGDIASELDSEDAGVSEESAMDSFARMRQKAASGDTLGEVLEGGEGLGSVAPSGWDDESGEFSVSEAQESEAQKAADRKVMRDSRNLAANVGNFGLFLLLAVVAGYFIGQFLDDFFGTKPVFTVFWVVCGIAASVKELAANLKAAKRLAEEESDTSSGGSGV